MMHYGILINMPIRNLQSLEPSFDVRAKYCEIGALLRDFNLNLLNCYRRFEVMSDISKDVNGANRCV